MKNLTQEWESVGDKLRDFTYIFYKVWELGIPSFDATVPTACVVFDKSGQNIGFHFNPTFWNKLTVYQRAFVTAHESLHVILNHGFRGKNLEPKIANIAMDVVVNTMLTDFYEFDRTKLGTLDETGCWLDTVFPKGGILYDQNMEYYYHELLSAADIQYTDGLTFVDEHSTLRGVDTSGVSSDLPSDVQDDATDAQKKDGPSPAGTGEGTDKTERIEKVAVRLSWTTLFKEFFRKNVTRPDELEQWARLHRRMQSMDPSIMLPSEAHDLEVEKPGKIPIWLFLDVSGSCDGYRRYFLKAYATIPKEFFDIKVFTFDTGCRPLTIRPDGTAAFPYGGGTSFSCIESRIRAKMFSESIAYPKLVLVFTDGEGNSVNPQFPERWHWFLIGGIYASTRRYIHSRSKVYKLNDIIGQ